MGTPVWVLLSTLRFHQSSENCGKTLSSTGNAITYIPGRLAATVNLPVTVLSTAGSVTANCFEPGICSQLGQIRACPQSDILFSGSSLQSGEGYDRPFTRQNIEIAKTYLEDVGISFSVCPGDTFLTRRDGIYGPPITRWQGSQTITTKACERSLVSGKSVLGLPYSIGSLVQARSRAMAEQGFSFCYGSTGSTSPRFASVQGCKSDRLGCPFERSLSFGPMVCSMEQRTHQCSGTPSSSAGPEVLLSGNFRLPCVAVDRQHNCGGLPEGGGGAGLGHCRLWQPSYWHGVRGDKCL